MIYAPPQFISTLCPLQKRKFFLCLLPLILSLFKGVVGVRNRYVKKLFGFTALQESYNGLTAFVSLKIREVPPFWSVLL